MTKKRGGWVGGLGGGAGREREGANYAKDFSLGEKGPK